MSKFLNQASKEVSRLESINPDVDFHKSKENIGNRLHVNGEFDLDKLTSSLADLNGLNSTFSKEFAKVYPKTQPIVDRTLKDIEEIIDSSSESKSSEELADKVKERMLTLEVEIGKVFKPLSKQYKLKDGNHYPGGLTFKHTRKSGTDTYRLEKTSVFNGELEVGTVSQIESLISELQNTVKSMEEFKTPIDVISDLLEEATSIEKEVDMSMEAWRDKDTDRLKRFAKYYVVSILILMIIAAISAPLAGSGSAILMLSTVGITPLIVNWGSSWLFLFSAIRGATNNDKVSDKYYANTKYLREIKTIVAKQMMDIVKYQNDTTLAGISYISSTVSQSK